MKLRNRKSFITTLPEQESPRPRGPRITHYLYVFALASLLAYIAYIIWDQVFFLEGTGVVEVERVTVSSTRGGRIDALSVTGGDRVSEGQRIGVIAAAETCDDMPDTDRLERLRMEAAMTQVRIDTLRSQLADRRSRLSERRTLRRALEIDTRMNDETRSLREDVRALQEEIALKTKRFSIKQERAAALGSRLEQRVLPRECRPEYLVAPRGGEVLAVSPQPGEVATRAEPLVTLIPSGADVRVNAAFPNNELGGVRIGYQMTIEFPDGSKSIGRVGRVHSPESYVVRRQWEPVPEPTEQIRATLYPADQDSTDTWIRYDRMAVTVRSRR